MSSYKRKYIFALLVLMLVAGGCRGTAAGGEATGGEATGGAATSAAADIAAAGGDTLYAPRHASGFSVLATGGSSTVVSIRDPWQGAQGVEMQLFLARDGETPPDGFRGAAANAPLQRVVCMSSSYVAFIDALGETDAVKAVSGARYIYNDTIRARYARGEVKDVGYDAGLNYELVASLRPDLVLLYGISGDNASLTRKLRELGVTYIYIGEYVETAPLGKAEWLVAMGEMFDKRELAEQIFARTETAYLETKGRISRDASGVESSGPTVMLNAPYRDTWFVPGDRSYMVQLIRDAGAAYACAGVDSEQSRPISVESAYIYAGRADVWLNPGQVSTLAELKALNPRFASIPAVTGDRVFNCNRRSTPDGGSDFWESGALRPDIVLADMAAMLHPALYGDRELHYFKHIR